MTDCLNVESAPWSDVVLICAKCAAKLGRGRKGKTELRGEIRHALKRRGLGKTVRVVETACLDLCPKGGQTVATRGLLAEGRLMVVGPDADGETVAKLLFDRSAALVAGAGTGSDRGQTKTSGGPASGLTHAGRSPCPKST